MSSPARLRIAMALLAGGLLVALFPPPPPFADLVALRSPPLWHDGALDPYGEPSFKELWAQRSGWDRWVPREEWDPDGSGFDAVHVDLQLEPIFSDSSVSGAAEWRLAVTADALAAVVLDFSDNLTIHSAMIGGLPAAFDQAADTLRLYLPAPALAGDTLRVAIAYSGRPEPGFLVGFKFDEHSGVPIVYTNCEPLGAHTWWPCKDRPDDKFTADLRFVVPDSMFAASNGLLVARVPFADRRMLYHWQVRYPITSYLIALTATNFAEFHDTYEARDGTLMPLDYYAYPEDLARAMQDWAFTPAAITFFAATFGEYPFLDEKYGMVEFPWIGAMEHQTLTSMGEYFLRLDHPSDWVVVHELAHQWWGNWVTCGTWRDIWLNEGFAVYCEALWAEHLAGPDSLRYQMNRFRRDSYRGTVYDPDFLFNSTVYRKGAWVLHMLRHVVGDEVFFAALREYGEAHAYGAAVTADLQAAFEETWGHDLDWFFDQWVYGEGQPRYRVYWNPAAAEVTGRTNVTITVVQETTGPEYFKMPLDARFVLRDGTDFWAVLWDSLPEQIFHVSTPSPPESLQIDPHDWVLGRVLYVADPADVPDATQASRVRLWLGAPQPNPARFMTTIPVYAAVIERDRATGEPLAPASAARSSGDALAETDPRLVILDAEGRVAVRLGLSERAVSAGLYRWDGRNAQGHRVPPGVYLGRIEGRDGASVRILLVK